MNNLQPTITQTTEVRLQSDAQPQTVDAGKSLIQEVELLRQQVQQLCQAVRGLVSLQAVMDRKLDAALKGGAGCDVAVL
jgi:hypothetical protein